MSDQSNVNGSETVAPPAGDSGVGGGGTGAVLVIWTFSVAEGSPRTLSTETERTRLKEIVLKAHARGRLVRFWDTPEDPAFWKELRAGGVDLINTDKLPELRRFLLTRD